jgi:hypothetical protein
MEPNESGVKFPSFSMSQKDYDSLLNLIRTTLAQHKVPPNLTPEYVLQSVGEISSCKLDLEKRIKKTFEKLKSRRDLNSQPDDLYIWQLKLRPQFEKTRQLLARQLPKSKEILDSFNRFLSIEFPSNGILTTQQREEILKFKNELTSRQSRKELSTRRTSAEISMELISELSGFATRLEFYISNDRALLDNNQILTMKGD